MGKILFLKIYQNIAGISFLIDPMEISDDLLSGLSYGLEFIYIVLQYMYMAFNEHLFVLILFCRI